MKKFKKLTSLILALLMVCTSFAWNGVEVQAETVAVASGLAANMTMTDTTTKTFPNDEITNDELALEGAVELVGSFSFHKSSKYYRLRALGSSFVKVKLDESYSSVEISFKQGGRSGFVSLGGTATEDYVYLGKGYANSEVQSVTLELAENGNWKYTPYYSENATPSGSVTGGEVDFGDGYIYFGIDPDTTSGTYALYSFEVTAEKVDPFTVGEAGFSTFAEALAAADADTAIVLNKDLK